MAHTPVALALLSAVAATTGADYQTYGNGYSGNYQHYMAGYAGDSTGSGSRASNYMPRDTEASEPSPEQYAEGYIPHIRNASDPMAWRDAFVKEYAEPYRHYIDAHERMAEKYPHVKSSAADCHTLRELKEWRAAQRMLMDSYIPRQYRAFSAGAVDQEYEENKARIEEEMAAKEANETKAERSPRERVPRDEEPGAAPREEARGNRGSEAAPRGHGPDSHPLLLAGLGSDAEPEPAEPGPSPGWEASSPSSNRYVHKYASDYAPMPDTTNDPKAWRDKFVNKYAAAYKKYLDAADRLSEQYSTTPIRAEDAHTMRELRKWRKAQRTQIGTFIPRDYRSFVSGAVEQEYERNKERIEKEMSQAEEQSGHTTSGPGEEQTGGAASTEPPRGGAAKGEEPSRTPRAEEEESPKGQAPTEEAGGAPKREAEKPSKEVSEGEAPSSALRGEAAGSPLGGHAPRGEEQPGRAPKREAAGSPLGGHAPRGEEEPGGAPKREVATPASWVAANAPAGFMAAALGEAAASAAALPGAQFLTACAVGALLAASGALIVAVAQPRIWRPPAGSTVQEQLLRPEAPLASV